MPGSFQGRPVSQRASLWDNPQYVSIMKQAPSLFLRIYYAAKVTGKLYGRISIPHAT